MKIKLIRRLVYWFDEESLNITDMAGMILMLLGAAGLILLGIGGSLLNPTWTHTQLFLNLWIWWVASVVVVVLGYKLIERGRN